ncbi:MAG TPA: EamA family transporter [Thermoanaerobaculia bacterium]|jgi:drug/metabolite transporter (DMT)-like permease|nr:EamA family transporter [Thermoanaerobaculia bacterium]
MRPDRARAYAAFAVVCIVWGTTYLAIRIAVTTMTPFLLTGARYTFAGIVLFIFAKLHGDKIPRDRRIITDIVICGVLMVAVGNLTVVWAEQWVPSGFAALFVGTAPFWATLLELLRRSGERLEPRAGLGMLIGFAGVAMLVTPRGAGSAFDRRFVIGALVIQLGSIAWQYGTIRGKYALVSVPPLMSSALQMLAGGFVVTIAGVAIGEIPHFHSTPRTFAALAYLSIFGSVLAYTSYVYAARHLRSTNMSLYAYVNPVVAVILGWFVLHEQLTWVSITAMIVILGGVAMVQSGRGPRRNVTISREAPRQRAA